ncbi:MAG: YceI family protein [Bacteroidales bacterium]|nr:YceI family protein [Bacteroidales bacterium]
MKNKFLLIILISFLAVTAQAQKQITKTGTVEIFSETPLFTIDGINKKVASILNTETGDIVASTLVRSFKFEEALVEEHFNENYIESHKFTKSVFKGKIINFDVANFSIDGSYDVLFQGKFTIHGETRDIEEKGIITVKDGLISAESEFHISLENYKVKVEKSYKKAIKDEILLKIKFDYKPYNK